MIKIKSLSEIESNIKREIKDLKDKLKTLDSFIELTHPQYTDNLPDSDEKATLVMMHEGFYEERVRVKKELESLENLVTIRDHKDNKYYRGILLHAYNNSDIELPTQYKLCTGE